MRWYILKTLLTKEALRQLADRGGIFLALLLMAAALLLSLFGKDDPLAPGGTGTIRYYVVDYWERDSPWIKHLAAHAPADFRVRFRHASQVPTDAKGAIQYSRGVAAVQVRVQPERDRAGRPRYLIQFWQPSQDPAEIAPLAEWFWRETQRFYHNTPLAIETTDNPVVDADTKAAVEIRPVGKDDEGRIISRYLFHPVGNGTPPFEQWLAKQSPGLVREPLQIEVSRHELGDRAEMRTMIATSLVVFAVCFFCVYLLPAFTCEERERGVLLAQALSPASTGEIFLAKFLFYPMLGVLLGAALAGIFRGSVLLRPFFWLSLLVTSVGYLGIGLTIASLAKTQRRASLTALCYMLAIALFGIICQQNNIPFLPELTLEYHAPRMLHAALANQIHWYHWFHLAGAAVLAAIWATTAAILFRRRGWQ